MSTLISSYDNTSHGETTGVLFDEARSQATKGRTFVLSRRKDRHYFSLPFLLIDHLPGGKFNI